VLNGVESVALLGSLVVLLKGFWTVSSWAALLSEVVSAIIQDWDPSMSGMVYLA
jgi:hypothetical protein